MLDDISKQGQWWLPNDASHRESGMFEFSPVKGIRLDVNGVLESGDEMGGGLHPVAFGTTADGKLVTLTDLHLSRSTVTFPGYAVGQYHAHFAFIGAHIGEATAASFDTFRVRLWNFEEFVGASGLTVPDFMSLELKGTFPAIPIAHTNGFRLTIENELVRHGDGHTEIGIRQKWFAVFRCESQTTVQQFLRGPLTALQSMLELACGGMVPIEEIEAVDESGEPVRILFRQRSFSTRPARKPSIELAFTIAALGEAWETHLNNWVAAKQRYGPTLDHFFSLNRSDGMPLEIRFLSIVQALESYHRRWKPLITRESKEAFKIRKKRLRKALVPSDRRWLLDVVAHANELRLKDRLKDLWQRMPPAVQSTLGDEAEFGAAVTDTRNYLTHYSEPRRRHVAAGSDLARLTLKLEVVLRAVFLQELGVDIDAVLSRPWGSRLLARLNWH